MSPGVQLNAPRSEAPTLRRSLSRGPRSPFCVFRGFLSVSSRSVRVFRGSTSQRSLRLITAAWLLFLTATLSTFARQSDTPPAVTNSPAVDWSILTNTARQFGITNYSVKGDILLTSNAFTAVLERPQTTSVSLMDILRGASMLQQKYRAGGFTNVVISLGLDQMTNGLATFTVFRGAMAQVLVDGKCVWTTEPDSALGAMREAQGAGPGTNTATTAQAPSAAGGTNAPPTATTNRPAPGILVRAYEIHGDTLLTRETLTGIFDKYTGTNVTIAEILKAATDLQMEYRARGFATIKVLLPPQTPSTNDNMIQIEVVEGRLAQVNVVGNRFFTSNNVMRALPSLHTNMILIEPIYQAELDRANNNQDRTIYGEISPGPVPGTSILDLKVKDRLPLHAKIDFNNQNSPGTPDLRLNTSASYQNLWQLEHSIGIQYSFSPEVYKTGDQWNFYDKPLVANYSAFYRMPLANTAPVAEQLASSAGSFGYNEATRKFQLPPSSDRSELNVYASRSTIDTGVMALFSGNLYNTNGNSLDRTDVQQDLTISSDVGGRLTLPLRTVGKFQSGFSFGPDYKTYQLSSYKTNIFTLTSEILDTISNPGHTITNINVSTIYSPVPTTTRDLDYLPLSLRYDANLRDPLGITVFGLGLSANAWFSGSISRLQTITASSESSGHWVTLNPSLSRDFLIHTNWVLSLHGEGQWTDQPLISNEQFGIGGVNSVRGYQEGQVFGDTGWWVGVEQKTPPQVIGMVYRNHPLTVRGSMYMEYGEVYLLDPLGRQASTALWGTGFGAVASIGATWEAKFLFSWPLLTVGTAQAYQPRFNFSLSAQF